MGDGYRCQLRYADICVGRASQVDHIVQLEAGGGNDVANLRAVCVRCHARRTGRQGALANSALPGGGIAGEIPRLPLRPEWLRFDQLRLADR